MMRDLDLSRVEFHAEGDGALTRFEVVAPMDGQISVHHYGLTAREAIRRYHLTGAAAIASGEGAADLAAQLLALRDGVAEA